METRRSRRIPACALAFLPLLLVAAAPAAGATRLTSANSVLQEFQSTTVAELGGSGCGASASSVKPLPAGSTAINVTEPKVGDRDPRGNTRVSAVAVAGTQITVTVVADGAAACAPGDPEEGLEPPESRLWRAAYDVRAEYARRLQVGIRNSYFPNRYKVVQRPRRISDGPHDKITGIRWKRFGGRKAIGSGIYRRESGFPGHPCTRRTCPEDNRRVRIVGTKPVFCGESGRFEYESVNIYLRGRLHSGYKPYCG